MMTDSDNAKPTKIDQVRADRACIGCGFNLFGQTVTKEEHYGLAITRCPECGEVAALQTYPVMSHWVNRFRGLLAAFWVFALFAFFIANMLAFMGLTMGACSLAGEEMSEHIAIANYEWIAEKDAALQASAANATPTPTTITTSTTTAINGVPVPAAAAVTYSPGQYTWTPVDLVWYDKHLDQTIADHGGVLANLDWTFLTMLVPGFFVALSTGVFWSVALLAASRLKVLWVSATISLMAYGIVYAASVPGRVWVMASQIGQELYVPIVGPIYLVYLVLIMAFGIWCGRKLARQLVLLTLQPNARVSLSILWTRDGLELPKS